MGAVQSSTEHHSIDRISSTDSSRKRFTANDQRRSLESNQKTSFNSGQQISFDGNSNVSCESDSKETTDSHVKRPDTSKKVNELRFQNIYYSATNIKGDRRQILMNVSGIIRSREVLAILGPSGAGKSSLLNALTRNITGRSAKLTGSCTLNGFKVTKEIFSEHFCFVPQDDSLLERLGLDSCADTRCGNQFFAGLSGGQKKRLSLAVALLKRPSVILLDEPTSGLDAAASFHVMQYVNEIATFRNIAVVQTIHQPSSAIFSNFTKVMLMSKGHCVYFGSPIDSIAHFAKLPYVLPPSTNPAEFLLEIINSEFVNPETVQRVIDAWADVDVMIADEAAEKTKKAETLPTHRQLESVGVDLSARGSASPVSLASMIRELSLVLTRQMCIILRDPMLYLGRAIMFLVTGIFIGVFYLQDRNLNQDHVVSRFWAAGWFLSVPSLFGVVAVYAFSEEFKSIRTEVKNGMFSARSYLLSTLLMQLPMMPFLGICAVGVSGFGILDFDANNFVILVCMYSVILFCYECMALFYSALFENPLLGMLCFLVSWFSSFLCSGIFVPPEDVVWPLRALFTIMPLKYGSNAISYLNTIDETFGGAWPCSDPSQAGCLYHYTSSGQLRLPGWTCAPGGDPSNAAAEQPQACYGYYGWQVLESLKVTFSALGSDDLITEDFGVVIAIGFGYLFLHFVLVVFKVYSGSEIVQATTEGAAAPKKLKSPVHLGGQYEEPLLPA